MRRFLAAGAILAGALALTGCGGGSSRGSTDTVVIPITVKGSQVTPNGDRVSVDTGQPVELEVRADEPGEIHVHSDPEQELSYDAGTTTLDLEPIDRPGLVAVESHTLDKTIVQLEVR